MYAKEESELEAVSDLFVVWGKCGHGMHLMCSNFFDPNGRDPETSQGVRDGGCLRCPECSEPWRGDFIEKISEFEVRAPAIARAREPASAALDLPDVGLCVAAGGDRQPRGRRPRCVDRVPAAASGPRIWLPYGRGVQLR